MKTCASCGKKKKDGMYRKDGRYKDNLSPLCHDCRKTSLASDTAALTRILAGVPELDRMKVLRRVFEALPTIDIPGVPILAAGGPYFGQGSPPEGDFFTKEDLDLFAEQTNKLMAAGELRPPSKLGHSEEQRLLNNSGLPVGDELPAAGWLDNFRVEKIGGIWKLLTDVKNVPAKLGQILASGGYRTRSMELSRVTSQVSGETYDGVVTGLAWLGAKAPAVRTLDDVWNLYATGDVVWEEEDGVMDLLSDLTAAINAEIAPDEPSYMWELWVNDVNLTLDKCTASDWDSDTTWIIPFTVGDNNEPTVAAQDEWVPSTMKLVQIDAADADTLGAGGGMADMDDEYGERDYFATRRAARAKFLERAADTKGVKLTDKQVQELAKTFSIEGEGADLRSKVEEHMKTFAADEQPPTPTPPTPTPPAPTPPEPTPPSVTLSTFSAEQRAELMPLIEDLTERATRGDRAYATQFSEAREGHILRAMNECRLDPADAEQWRAFYNANPQLAAKQLEKLPVNPGLIVTFGTDEDGLTAEQRAATDSAVEDAYLVATGATDPQKAAA